MGCGFERLRAITKVLWLLGKKQKQSISLCFFQPIDSSKMNGIDLNINLIKILILRVLIRGMDRKLVTNQQKIVP